MVTMKQREWSSILKSIVFGTVLGGNSLIFKMLHFHLRAPWYSDATGDDNYLPTFSIFGLSDITKIIKIN
jgi:hypothetical protein